MLHDAKASIDHVVYSVRAQRKPAPLKLGLIVGSFLVFAFSFMPAFLVFGEDHPLLFLGYMATGLAIYFPLIMLWKRRDIYSCHVLTADRELALKKKNTLIRRVPFDQIESILVEPAEDFDRAVEFSQYVTDPHVVSIRLKDGSILAWSTATCQRRIADESARQLKSAVFGEPT